MNQGGRSGAGYRLDAEHVVQRGRRREFRATIAIAVGLFALQWPLRQVATGDLRSEYPLPPVVPGRLSLVVDAFLILSYLYVAYRAWGLVRSHRASPGVRRWCLAGLGLVLVGAAMDVWEDIRLWDLLGAADEPGGTVSLSLTFDDALGDWCPLPAGTSYSAVMVLCVFVGLVVGVLTTFARGRETARGAPSAAAEGTADETVICCSGGGIRSSAFSLGALQVLSERGIYDEASAVVGVSGGGYVAAALHTVRWGPADDEDDVSGEWRDLPGGERAFSLRSPETQWVRRNTRYVLDSIRVAAQAALSLLFGIAVNLLLIAIALGGLAWLLAWFYLASGRLEPWQSPGALETMKAEPFDDALGQGIGGQFADQWPVPLLVGAVLAVGLGAFLLEQAWDRFRTVGEGQRRVLRTTSVWVLGVGIVLALLLLVLPALIEAVVSYTAGSGSAWARLFYQLGFVPEDVCNAILARDEYSSACGVKAAMAPVGATAVSVVSIAGIVSAILGVLASAKSAAGGSTSGKSGLGGLLAKVWAKIKDPIVPWAAVTAVVLIALVALMRWITQLVTSPSLLEQWKYVAIFGGLLVLTKVITEPNHTSMHHFFRERISHAFLVRRLEDRVEPVPYRRPLRYSQAAPPAHGGPRLVTCAVANVTDQDLVPSRRGCTPFVFDHDRMGLTDRLLPEWAALRPSGTYEFAADHGYRDATIPAAVAISAAAFSPLAGRENVRLGPYRAVLALGNARLGVWLPNPIWIDEAGLVRRLLRLGRLDEAAAAWSMLPESERDYLGLSDARLGELARGAQWPALRAALQAVRQAMRQAGEPGDDERRAAALAAARAALTAAGRQVPDGLDLPGAVEELDAAIDRPAGAGVRIWRGVEIVRSVFKKPGLSRLVKEAVGRASVYDRFLYITDGGHYDNLGLIEALRRKPRDIYVLDASNDPEDTFRTLGRTVATARMDLDCEITIDPSGLRRLGALRSGAAWCTGRYAYSDGSASGRIFFVKAILTEHLGWDIETYAADNVDFPRTSTGNQLYSEFDFEAYRALGGHVVTTMLASADYLDEHDERDEHDETVGTGAR